MSTIPPPEGPTEPLGPRPAAVLHERVAAPVVAEDVLLRGAIDSLRTWLLVVGILALAALAVAVYAVVKADDANRPGGSRSGLATDARVDRISNELKALRATGTPGAGSTAGLSARVDQLSSQVQALRTGAGAGTGGSAALGARVATLESTVKTLASRPATGDSTQAITQLSSRVDTLTSDVAQLKQSQTNP
jgi:outer membrane murein-binding lipoprotein Lpp